jgi:hypothetical protein
MYYNTDFLKFCCTSNNQIFIFRLCVYSKNKDKLQNLFTHCLSYAHGLLTISFFYWGVHLLCTTDGTSDGIHWPFIVLRSPELTWVFLLVAVHVVDLQIQSWQHSTYSTCSSFITAPPQPTPVWPLISFIVSKILDSPGPHSWNWIVCNFFCLAIYLVTYIQMSSVPSHCLMSHFSLLITLKTCYRIFLRKQSRWFWWKREHSSGYAEEGTGLLVCGGLVWCCFVFKC